jgi:hypothetical protein
MKLATPLPGALLALTLALAGAPEAGARSAVFGGGPFYSGGSAVMNDLRASGFDDIVLWTIHINSNGNLVFNDTLVVSNGSYVGNSGWPGQLATLKQTPTSVNRIEVGVGSFGVDDFGSARNLMNAQGTGPTSILYRNFQALKNATHADAVNFDDEVLYDTATSVRLGVMLADLGYHVTLCPYTNPSHWAAVRTQINSQRPGTVDRIHLQVYAGGAGNDPASWNSTFGGFKVDPGLWSKHDAGCTAGDSPATVESKMRSWRTSAGIVGGFMWLYDDIQKCASQGTAAQYAGAINRAVGGGTVTPTPTPTPTPTAPGGFIEITPSGSAVTASTSDTNLPANSVDNNLATRWSGSGDGAWLKLDLGVRRTVSHVTVAWFSGDTRVNRFDLQRSDDAVAWANILTNISSSGTSTREETFDFADVDARYIRYVGHGNNEVGKTQWNSVAEISLFAPSGPTPTPIAPSPTPTPSPTSVPSATPTPGGGSPVEVTPGGSAVTASTNDGNLPANTVDRSLSTRWSASGDGQWIQYDLGTARTLTHVKVAFYNGNARQTHFDLQVSNGNGVWANVLTGAVSSGTTTQEETFDIPDTSARWLRYLGHGNSVNTWNSLLEVSLFALP